MDFTFSAEQDELRAAVRGLAADRATSADIRRAMESERGVDDALWRVVGAEMGLTGVGIAEDLGGAGGGFIDAAVVIEEAGRALLPVPLVSTLAAAQVLAGAGVAGAAGAAGADALRGLVSGGRVGAVGAGDHGSAANVLDGGVADVIVVATSDGLVVVGPGTSGVQVTPQQAIDPTRGQATVTYDAGSAEVVGDGAAAARAVDVLRVVLAVEAIGCARRCLEMTVEHLKTREQFGKPIGSFQALHHRAADLAVALESAASTAYYAAWAVADAPDELPVVAPLAKAACIDAAWTIAAETIQLHGGIGFTWEHDAHLFFKRVTTSRLLLGDSHEQRRLVAQRARLRG